MDGNSWTVFSYFPRAGIIQPKFIAAAQLRKILSKNAVTTPRADLLTPLPTPLSLLCHLVKSAESSLASPTANFSLGVFPIVPTVREHTRMHLA